MMVLCSPGNHRSFANPPIAVRAGRTSFQDRGSLDASGPCGQCGRYNGMKVRKIIKMLEEDGWYLVATRGSHRQYKHAGRPGRVTVPGKPNDDLAPGTLNSITKQAQLKGEQ